MATLSAPLSLSVYANHPLTETEAVGVPGWQTGIVPLQACKPICRALTWLTTALMEWYALHTILALEVWQALCLSQVPVEYKDLAVVTSTRVESAEDDPLLYK